MDEAYAEEVRVGLGDVVHLASNPEHEMTITRIMNDMADVAWFFGGMKQSDGGIPLAALRKVVNDE